MHLKIRIKTGNKFKLVSDDKDNKLFTVFIPNQSVKYPENYREEAGMIYINGDEIIEDNIGGYINEIRFISPETYKNNVIYVTFNVLWIVCDTDYDFFVKIEQQTTWSRLV